MRIDSHQHFWQVRRGDYPWLTPKLTALYRDFLPDDLRPLLRDNQIDKTIVVQAAPTVAETDFLLDLARQTDFVAGVVGWLDLESDDFADQFDHYRRDDLFIGIRPALEFMPDDRWILRPRVIENLKLIAAADFPIDLLTWPRHLPAILEMLNKVPELRGVVDHISKPNIKDHVVEPWRSLLKEVSRNPNILCKLSGIITQADHARWTVPDIRPFVEHAVDCFGVDRVMFGSDWPVANLAGTYEQTISSTRDAIGAALFGAEDRIFGLNAARFYKIPVGVESPVAR